MWEDLLTINVSLERTAWNMGIAGVLDSDQVIPRSKRSVAELVADVNLTTDQFNSRRSTNTDRQRTRPSLRRVDDELAQLACRIDKYNVTLICLPLYLYGALWSTTQLTPSCILCLMNSTEQLWPAIKNVSAASAYWRAIYFSSNCCRQLSVAYYIKL